MREVQERQKEAHEQQISLLKEAHAKQISATREHACKVQESFESEQRLSKRLAMQVSFKLNLTSTKLNPGITRV
jgi:hypothetical protein